MKNKVLLGLALLPTLLLTSCGSTKQTYTVFCSTYNNPCTGCHMLVNMKAELADKDIVSITCNTISAGSYSQDHYHYCVVYKKGK